MKKRSLMRVFISGFLKTLLTLVLMLGVGFTSYKLTMMHYEKADKGEQSEAEALIADIQKDPDFSTVSKNLIISQSDSGQILDMVLEIFNTETMNMDYVTIPANTSFAISDSLYTKITDAKLEMPQTIRLTNLHGFFEDSQKVAPFAVLLLNDALDAEIDTYTALSTDNFDNMFEDTTQDIVTDEDAGTITTYKVHGLSKKYKKSFFKLETEEQYQGFISNMYIGGFSNMTEETKYKYIPYYQKLNKDQIYLHCFFGEEVDGNYELDVQLTNGLLASIYSSEAYKKTQEEVVEEEQKTPMEDLKIEILNGSGIGGLAAAYQVKLTDDNLNVISIGNYDGGDYLTETKIVVKEDGMGEDLHRYFPNAQIEKSYISSEADVQVILGTDADLEE
ncbi:MAG: LytR C-terminal domain-containing protein [Lachnospiraceae bacterium]|nr:LytR C-terminal domain-containing protein [Lachnospiraceae bacterium]